MALTLNDVDKKKRKPTAKTTKTTPKKKKVTVKRAASASTTKKVRPWQTAEETEAIEQAKNKARRRNNKSKKNMKPTVPSKEPASKVKQPMEPMLIAGHKIPKEVVEILQRMEGFKNEWLSQLPPEINAFVKDSWVTKLQVYPKIKIPIPQFLTRKED